MERSHSAEWEFTGRFETSVFQTLSLGNTVQVGPGTGWRPPPAEAGATGASRTARHAIASAARRRPITRVNLPIGKASDGTGLVLDGSNATPTWDFRVLTGHPPGREHPPDVGHPGPTRERGNPPMRRVGVAVALAVVAALFFVGAGSASASTKVIVGTPGPGCSPTASTIQGGVNAVSPGGSVVICPGTYTEQVTVTTSNITIKPMKPSTVIVQAPASMTSPKAIFRVNGATGVTIRKLTIQGPGG